MNFNDVVCLLLDVVVQWCEIVVGVRMREFGKDLVGCGGGVTYFSNASCDQYCDMHLSQEALVHGPGVLFL